MTEPILRTACSVSDDPSEVDWPAVLDRFRDGSIYQTAAYGARRWGHSRLSYLLLEEHGEVVAAAQTATLGLPLLGDRVAYLYRGPLWRPRERRENRQTLRTMLRALIEEYVEKRRLFLRIVPNEYRGTAFGSTELLRLYQEEGLHLNRLAPDSRTILLGLESPLQDLEKSLDRKWRENLRRARRNGLEVVEGAAPQLYSRFEELYRQMRERKRFVEFMDVGLFERIQEGLADRQKMRIMICREKQEDVAASVWSGMGETGLPLFSATGNAGRKSRGAYLLRWLMVKRMQEMGLKRLDQGGINRRRNPGGYRFKSGMGGVETDFLGQFDRCRSVPVSLVLGLGEIFLRGSRKIRLAAARLGRWTG